MDIQIEKLELIEWITKLQVYSIIEKLMELKEEYIKGTDWSDEISNEDKESIARGLDDFNTGNIHSHESVKKLYGKYL